MGAGRESGRRNGGLKPGRAFRRVSRYKPIQAASRMGVTMAHVHNLIGGWE